MVEHKDWGSAEAERQDAMSKAASERPEADEFYSEIRASDSVIEMPGGEDVLSRSVEEDDIGPAETKGNSKAFEEEMDDL